MRRAPSMLDRYARDVLLRWRTRCRPLNSGRLSGPRIHHCSRKTFASLSITVTGVIWAICRRQIEIAGDRLGVHRRVTSRTGRAYSICRSSISAGFVLVRTSSIVARVTRHHQNHGQLALALFRISCVVWPGSSVRWRVTAEGIASAVITVSCRGCCYCCWHCLLLLTARDVARRPVVVIYISNR